ncbi:mediator of RNA polymerase II transcription subunit 9 [Emydura macquarii macquarii]|uniref:mediator of RNA polymerase II transcription subunit 9 n=1 Tax=Emydura macquarii macquarii TaxID=1129001 RepID=UPI00352A1730
MAAGRGSSLHAHTPRAQLTCNERSRAGARGRACGTYISRDRRRAEGIMAAAGAGAGGGPRPGAEEQQQQQQQQPPPPAQAPQPPEQQGEQKPQLQPPPQPQPPQQLGQEDFSFLPLVHDIIKCMDKDSQDVHQVLNELKSKFQEMRKVISAMPGIGLSPQQQQQQLHSLREQVRTKNELLQKYKSLCMFEIPKE